MNLYARFRERFPAERTATCLAPSGGDPISFAALDADTARMQAELAARGVGPGDRVAAQIEKSADAVRLYLACLRRGAVFVPLNTAYTDAELAFFLRVPTGGRVAYMDTIAALDGFVELIEIGGAFEPAFNRFYRATIGWDGKDPVRSFV